jgi:hypothetical protein
VNIFTRLSRSAEGRSYLFFLLAVLSGWCVFSLQSVSIITLLQRSGIEVLPGVMIFQALSSWMLLKIWGKAALDSSRKFVFMAFGGGLFIALCTHVPFENFTALLPFLETNPTLFWGFLFILSQLTISALRMGIHVTFSKQISVLRNPQISTQLSIAEESGFLLGILLLIFTTHPMSAESLILALFPFSAAVLLFTMLKDETSSNPKSGIRETLKSVGEALNPFSKEEASTLLNAKRKPPYFYYLVGLFMVVASLKSLQWFGMAYGLSEATKNGSNLVSVFSKMSLIQSLSTLAILVASLNFSRKIPTWSVGFKTLLSTQGFLGSLLTVFPNAYPMMGSEILRKVLEHGFLGRSLQLLTSTLPDHHRLEMRHILERWSTTSGTLIVGTAALAVIHGWLPISVLFAASVLLAVVGLRLRRKLFDTLCDLHLASLSSPKLESVIQACYVLANPECRQHHAALSVLVERQPRPAVLKSALTALGRMQNPTAINTIKKFLSHSREDIQVASIKALQNYSGHEMNLILLKTLRDLLRSEQVIKASVVKTLTDRLGRLAIPYLLEVLETSHQERSMGNTIEILGEIAVRYRDRDLMDYLSRYLEADVPRRPRANATVVLYGHPIHGEKAQECFDRFMTSEDSKDQRSFAYIASMLGLGGHENFIWSCSEKLEHKDMAILTALLRLNNPDVPGLLARVLVGEDEDLSIDALVRLSGVPLKIRSRVFFEVLEISPHRLGALFELMRSSQRDFEIDRELLREEARRLDIRNDEEPSQEKTTSVRKNVA